MDLAIPASLESFPQHRAKVEAACRAAFDNPDVVAMAVAGSFAAGNADMLSDVDLRIYVPPEVLERTIGWIPILAAASGHLVAHFTGEHVGIPRLTIVLYDDLVHVDFEVLPSTGVGEHNQGLPVIVLWERDGISDELPGSYRVDVAEDLRWLEARVWTWCWDIQTKVMRGELYEALDIIQYVRHRVLFRLVAFERGVRPAGGRRVDAVLGKRSAAFASTVPANLDAVAVLEALRAEIALYVELTDQLFERYDVTPSLEARAIAGRALELGMSWRPETA